MNVQTPVPLSAVPIAGVYTPDAATWYMVTSPSTAINLATGLSITLNNLGIPVMYFPSATLCFD